ncbi:MAG: hypothetical protein JSS49_22155 [Planctomycetes bacterium]|nr:hypothetical protein [Planctomycetota bacterium]
MRIHQFRRQYSVLGLFVVLGIGCGGELKPSITTTATEAAQPAGETHRQVQSTDAQDSPSVAAATTPGQKPAREEESAPKADKAVEVKEMNWDELQELIASHKGKIVVVDIWSTSCEPCLRELPFLMKLQSRHADDVVCISFDCDYDGRKSKPVAYYRERVLKALTNLHAETVINAMCTTAADELFQKIDLDSIPAVYVYDRTGQVAKRFDNRTPIGDAEEGISYEKQIDPLVAELVKADKN